MAKFSSFEVHQIPVEENEEADCLAWLASSPDIGKEIKVTMLMAEGKSIDEGEMLEICENKD